MGQSSTSNNDNDKINVKPQSCTVKKNKISKCIINISHNFSTCELSNNSDAKK